ncbi:MAG: hypothetical protein [Arizlama microvirus]|nr:MAG: hypothetical protein [Arizlama microvirus]
MRRWFLFLVLCFTLIGCHTVKKSLDNYEACKGDQVCMEEMTKVKESSYVISKSAVAAYPLPSVGEGIALLVSNLVAFGFGVLKGRKKG